MFSDRTGVGLGHERMPLLTNHIAEGLTVLEVVPARHEIAQRIAAARCWRWVWMASMYQ
jgi:hypothetical protein